MECLSEIHGQESGGSCATAAELFQEKPQKSTATLERPQTETIASAQDMLANLGARQSELEEELRRVRLDELSGVTANRKRTSRNVEKELQANQQAIQAARAELNTQHDHEKTRSLGLHRPKLLEHRAAVRAAARVLRDKVAEWQAFLQDL